MRGFKISDHVKGLGARRLEADAIEEHGTRWVVMADPEGNEFCVCDGEAI
jgi:hypothetical protein